MFNKWNLQPWHRIEESWSNIGLLERNRLYMKRKTDYFRLNYLGNFGLGKVDFPSTKSVFRIKDIFDEKVEWHN